MSYTKINYDQCDKVALVLQKLNPKPEFYNRDFLLPKVDPESHFRAITFAVTICHQTYNLHHPTLNLFGWDYLEYVYSGLANEHSELIEPFRISGLPIEKLKQSFSVLFSYDGDPKNCTLDRLDERIGLLKEVAGYSIQHFGGSIQSWFENYGNRLLNGGQGIYEKMPELKTFSDPYFKKLTFLVKLLEEAGLIKILDPEHFIPIMDYHMQRVLLRMGCVEITDRLLKRQLSKRVKVNDDSEIRSSCINAFRYISEKSGKQIIKLNDFFWSLGRSCCNETTLCRDRHCQKSPCTFETIIDLNGHHFCPFMDACKAYSDDDYLKLWQPMVETNFY